MSSIYENKVSIHTLQSGLRCVYLYSPSAVDYLGVMINAGSRDETLGAEGLAHFVEHTIFKGTGRRKSWHIINRMEACGGELNAYTTKETTVVYTTFPAGNLDRAADLLADLITDSQFPEKEIDREREVVADEINSYLDMPSESVFDDFEDMIFAGSGLGHNILGTTDSLSRFTPITCRRWLSDYFVTSNMVLCYSGNMPADKVWKKLERYFTGVNRGEAPLSRVKPDSQPTFNHCRNLGNHQAHTVMGARIPDMYSPHCHAMALLVNILGGPGMNSLLNVALREKRGLVYSVDASTVLFTDSGLLQIYFGCDSADTDRCRRLIENLITRLAETPLTAHALAAAKRQYLGQLTVAGDNREAALMSVARSVLYHNRVISDVERRHIVERLSAEELIQCAQFIRPELLSSLTFI
ncbi:MAG: insulinase family protein [Paramuribaculum sp.]|nr:insulinase family protein [Paramuribaculum sp.]